jgi:RNA polymerase sigma factor (sigma-70 family)
VTPPAEKLDLELLRRRDAGEFTRFVRQHEGLVMGLCQSLGLTVHDREDAAAETFAIAYRGLPAFRGEAELSTWLYRIAYRTALKVRRRHPAVAEIGGDREDLSAESPDRQMQEREDRERVWRAVGSLEPEAAALVEMYYRRQMSVREIAAVTERPEATVKTLLFRTRERLREMLNVRTPG